MDDTEHRLTKLESDLKTLLVSVTIGTIFIETPSINRLVFIFFNGTIG